MACMYGRCGVGCAYVWRMHGVGVWCAMACIGVCGYGVQACVWRWCALGVYVWLACVYALGVCVWCTCVCRYIDVASLRRIRPNKTKHLKQSINDIKRITTNTKRMNAYSIVFKRMFT